MCIRDRIYGHSGTLGTSSVPVSPGYLVYTLDVSTLTTSFVLYTFSIATADQIYLLPSTNYVLVIEFLIDELTAQDIDVGVDASSPTHGGNASTRIYNSS